MGWFHSRVGMERPDRVQDTGGAGALSVAPGGGNRFVTGTF